jgi:stage V sporulation protein SpoVS
MPSAGSAIVTLALVTGNIVKYLGWGTGTTAYAATQTALVTPAAESRATCTITQQTTDHTNDTFQAVGTMTCASAAKAITEAAVFDASTVGNMYVRAAFDAMNVDVNDQIQFTFKVKHDHS